jgi:hypothetical protein
VLWPQVVVVFEKKRTNSPPTLAMNYLIGGKKF